MSVEHIVRAVRACGPRDGYPFGKPQEIADFNAAERRRKAQTPYGRHLTRLAEFDAGDHLTKEEWDAAFNEFGRKSRAQYLQEMGNEDAKQVV